jgi:hypothetical protein
MLNQFEAINKARAELENQGCSVVTCKRRAARPVITAQAPNDQPVWPFISIDVKEHGITRTVRTSRIHDCQIIWH